MNKTILNILTPLGFGLSYPPYCFVDLKIVVSWQSLNGLVELWIFEDLIRNLICHSPQSSHYIKKTIWELIHLICFRETDWICCKHHWTQVCLKTLLCNLQYVQLQSTTKNLISFLWEIDWALAYNKTRKAHTQSFLRSKINLHKSISTLSGQQLNWEVSH